MVFYGSRFVHINSMQSETTTCESCESRGSLTINMFRKHAHIFWVPVFPFTKVGESQCSHCKNILEPKEMPDQLKREYDRIKSISKGPIWQFSGLVVIALLIVYSAYVSGVNSKQELQYIETPLIGDVYKYKTEDGDYSTLKVVNLSSDTVFVSANEFVISKMSKVYKIDKAENYPDIFYGISKEELNKKYNSNEIYGINRH
jgi:hypothetical protein